MNSIVRNRQIIRVARDTKEQRKEARIAKDIKAVSYAAAIYSIRKINISQEVCTSL